jgi:hypothetical protein
MIHSSNECVLPLRNSSCSAAVLYWSVNDVDSLRDYKTTAHWCNNAIHGKVKVATLIVLDAAS